MTERDGFIVALRARWARSALLATTLALGLALVAASWANYRGTRAAVATLNRGHTEILENALRQAFGFPGNDGAAALEEVLESQQEAGLRFIALVDPDGTVVASAGEPNGAIVIPSNFSDRAREVGIVMVPVGDRIRAYLPRPVRNLGSGRRGGGFSGGFPLAVTVVEFEPLAANHLTSQARRSLVLGSVAAGLLTLAAILFWRQSSKYEAARRDLEQRRRLSQLGEMSAVLAHEIRNPLASLKGNAQLLAERLPEQSRERKRADRVVTEATRLEALTADLLNFARTGPIDLVEVDPVELVRLAAEEAGVRELRVEAVHAPRSWALDASRIRQALVNLIRNAAEASPPGTAPLARVLQIGGELVVEIQDHGAGVPEEDRARIFEPFFTTRTNGTGLGLSVARRVVELHGGTLSAEEPADGGALFRLVLPAQSRRS